MVVSTADPVRFHNLSPAELWYSKDPGPWNDLIEAFWRQPTVRRTLAIHKQLEHLNRDDILEQEPEGWYRWVRDTFMPWKFGKWVTGNQRSIDTQWRRRAGVSTIDRVRDTMQTAMDRDGVEGAVSLATTINGIGVSGGSALVTLLFPARSAIIDVRVVRFLRKIPDLDERDELPQLSIDCDFQLCDAVMISRVAARQAAHLNRRFSLQCWTSRLVERCMWTYDSECSRRRDA